MVLFCCCFVRLVFFCCFTCNFPWGGATAAAPKWYAAVDGNRKEVADHVASLQARLGDRGLEKLCCSCFPSVVQLQIVWFLLGIIYLSSSSLFLLSFSF